MVGGLVEQQQVGLFEQQLGQRDAHLPAAGELLGAALPIALAEAEAGEHGADLRFDGVAVARAELAFRAMEAVGHLRVLGAGGIEFAPCGAASCSCSSSSARRLANTVMHSAKTVRPESERPSCGR